MNHEIEQSICDAVGVLVDQKISHANFDTTIPAVVEAVLDESIGQFKVNYNGNSVTAYSVNGVNYSAGDNVFILIPQSNSNYKRIIIGHTEEAVNLGYVKRSGDTMYGDLRFGTGYHVYVDDMPEKDNELANKEYVDRLASSGVGRFEYVDDVRKGEYFNTYTGDNRNYATGDGSHAEGIASTAAGNYSHVQGGHNFTNEDFSFVGGTNNSLWKTASTSERTFLNGNEVIIREDGGNNIVFGANSSAVITGRNNFFNLYDTTVTGSNDSFGNFISIQNGSLVGLFNGQNKGNTIFGYGHNNITFNTSDGNFIEGTNHSANVMNSRGVSVFGADNDIVSSDNSGVNIFGNYLISTVVNSYGNTILGYNTTAVVVNGNGNLIGGHASKISTTASSGGNEGNLIFTNVSTVDGQNIRASIISGQEQDINNVQNLNGALISGYNNKISRLPTVPSIHAYNSTVDVGGAHIDINGYYLDVRGDGAGSHIGGHGVSVTKIGAGSFIDGYYNRCEQSGYGLFIEGAYNIIPASINAVGTHAGGYGTTARGSGSFTGGICTQTVAEGQTALGVANYIDSEMLFAIGNGEVSPSTGDGPSVISQSNALWVNRNGDLHIAGDIYLSGNNSIKSDTSSSNLKYVVTGYYKNNNFFEDSDYTKLIAISPEAIYIDLKDGTLWVHNGTKYTRNVDNELSDISTNPVQNNIVKKEIEYNSFEILNFSSTNSYSISTTETNIGTISLKARKNAEVRVEAEIDVTALATLTDTAAALKLSVNGTNHFRTAKETYLDGDHILHATFVIEVVEDTAYTLNLLLSATGGTLDVSYVDFNASGKGIVTLEPSISLVTWASLGTSTWTTVEDNYYWR